MKKKIVITNIGLNEYYGTETWTYAMAKELSKYNYDLTVYSPGIGKIAEKIKEFCEVTDVKNKHSYDLAIVNHNVNFNIDAKFKIFTSHSKFIDVEQPPKEAEHVYGVTEYIYPKVIRNGIDCDRFKPNGINDKLKNILYLSNPHYAGAKEFLREACEGYNLITLDEQRFDIESLIKEADLVISLGRGALESMAMGKNVIYADHRKGWMREFRGGGLITKDNYEDFKKGEWQKDRKLISIKKLREELEKYDKKIGEFNRQMILKDFNIKKTAKKYIDIWINTKRDI